VTDRNLEQLKIYQNNIKFVFCLCYPAKALLKENITSDRVKNTNLILDTQEIHYDSIVKTILEKDNLDELLVNVESGFIKNLITDSIASLSSYCMRTNQEDKAKQQPWYDFFRMVRNAFSHDNVWNFNTYYKSVLPLTYNGITISEDMEGKPLNFGDFNAHVAWHLLEDVKNFINKELI